MAQSPGAQLREKLALTVAIGQAVSDASKSVKDEAAARAAQVLAAQEKSSGDHSNAS